MIKIIHEDYLNEKMKSSDFVNLFLGLANICDPDNVLKDLRYDQIDIHHIDPGRPDYIHPSNLCLISKRDHGRLHQEYMERSTLGTVLPIENKEEYNALVKNNLYRYPHIKLSSIFNKLSQVCGQKSIEDEEDIENFTK